MRRRAAGRPASRLRSRRRRAESFARKWTGSLGNRRLRARGRRAGGRPSGLTWPWAGQPPFCWRYARRFGGKAGRGWGLSWPRRGPLPRRRRLCLRPLRAPPVQWSRSWRDRRLRRGGKGRPRLPPPCRRQPPAPPQASASRRTPLRRRRSRQRWPPRRPRRQRVSRRPLPRSWLCGLPRARR